MSFGSEPEAPRWIRTPRSASDGDRAFHLFDLLNQFTHGATPEQVAVYKVEPYVVAADVYSVAPHTGRGGWSWYTGSAGWMYRLVVESLLGVRLQADATGARLILAPCLPPGWPGYSLKYRYRETSYAIEIAQVAELAPGTLEVRVDGELQADGNVLLRNDKATHAVSVRVATRAIRAAVATA